MMLSHDAGPCHFICDQYCHKQLYTSKKPVSNVTDSRIQLTLDCVLVQRAPCRPAPAGAEGCSNALLTG
jgi:hypothetical protein